MEPQKNIENVKPQTGAQKSPSRSGRLDGRPEVKPPLPPETDLPEHQLQGEDRSSGRQTAGQYPGVLKPSSQSPQSGSQQTSKTLEDTPSPDEQVT